jgi:hypothetical protein
VPSNRPLVQKQAVEISPSVSIFFLEDLIGISGDPSNGGTNQCIEAVHRAAAFNNKRVNFVITWYFKDTDGDATPDFYCFR